MKKIIIVSLICILILTNTTTYAAKITIGMGKNGPEFVLELDEGDIDGIMDSLGYFSLGKKLIELQGIYLDNERKITLAYERQLAKLYIRSLNIYGSNFYINNTDEKNTKKSISTNELFIKDFISKGIPKGSEFLCTTELTLENKINTTIDKYNSATTLKFIQFNSTEIDLKPFLEKRNKYIDISSSIGCSKYIYDLGNNGLPRGVYSIQKSSEDIISYIKKQKIKLAKLKNKGEIKNKIEIKKIKTEISNITSSQIQILNNYLLK